MPEEPAHQRSGRDRGRRGSHHVGQRLPAERGFRQMTVGQTGAHHGAVTELRAYTGHGSIRGPEVSGGVLLEQPQLLARCVGRGDPQGDLRHPGGKGVALETEQHQIQDLPRIERWFSRTNLFDPLGARCGGARV